MTVEEPERESKFRQWEKRSEKEIDDRVKAVGIPVFLAQVFAAVIWGGCGFAVMLLVLGPETFTHIVQLIVAYLVPPMGKESIIPIGVTIFGIDPLVMSLSITFWDVTVAFFLLWNFGFIRLTPILGPWVIRTEEKGGDILRKKPWVRRLAFLGLSLFVFIPFQGSGAIVGTILGNLIGMRPLYIVLAIFVGTFTSTIIIAFFAGSIVDFFNGM